jgi:hypothetical protein
MDDPLDTERVRVVKLNLHGYSPWNFGLRC